MFLLIQWRRFVCSILVWIQYCHQGFWLAETLSASLSKTLEFWDWNLLQLFLPILEERFVNIMTFNMPAMALSPSKPTDGGIWISGGKTMSWLFTRGKSTKYQYKLKIKKSVFVYGTCRLCRLNNHGEVMLLGGSWRSSYSTIELLPINVICFWLTMTFTDIMDFIKYIVDRESEIYFNWTILYRIPYKYILVGFSIQTFL